MRRRGGKAPRGERWDAWAKISAFAETSGFSASDGPIVFSEYFSPAQLCAAAAEGIRREWGGHQCVLDR